MIIAFFWYIIDCMKTVLITGASRGIGRETALHFARQGYGVAVNYNNSENHAKTLIKQIKEIGGNAVMIKADVSDNAQVENMFKSAYQHFGKGTDVLINNAAVSLFGLFNETKNKDYKKLFDINLFGAFNCTNQALTYMISNKSGSIINISSIWGVCGASCEVHYSAGKAALIGFTKALAKEVAPSGITVNCIAPGVIDTDMNADLSETEKQELLRQIPLKRLGRVGDISGLALFLASGKARYITGQVISVNGGMFM